MSMYKYNVKVSKTQPSEIGGLWIKDNRVDTPIKTSFNTYNYFHDWWDVGNPNGTHPLGDGQIFEIGGKKILVNLGVGQTRGILYCNLDDQTVEVVPPPQSIDRSPLSEGELAYYNSLPSGTQEGMSPFYEDSIPGNNPRITYKISDTEMLIFNVEGGAMTGVFKYNVITHECSHLKQFCGDGSWDSTNMYREVTIEGNTYTLIQAIPYVNVYAPLGSGSSGTELWGITPQYINGKYVFTTQATSLASQQVGIMRFIYDMNNDTLEFIEDYPAANYVNGDWVSIPALSDYEVASMIGKSVYYGNALYEYLLVTDSDENYYDCIVKVIINNSDVSQETKEVIYLNKINFTEEQKSMAMIYALSLTGFVKGSTVNFLYDKNFIVIDTADDNVSQGFISMEHPLIDVNIAAEQFNHVDLLTPQVFLLDEDTQDYVFSTIIGGVAGSGGASISYKLMKVSFNNDISGLEDSIVICSSNSGKMVPLLSQYSSPDNKIDYPVSQVVYIDSNGDLESLAAAYAKMDSSEWIDL